MTMTMRMTVTVTAVVTASDNVNNDNNSKTISLVVYKKLVFNKISAIMKSDGDNEQ